MMSERTQSSTCPWCGQTLESPSAPSHRCGGSLARAPRDAWGERQPANVGDSEARARRMRGLWRASRCGCAST